MAWESTRSPRGTPTQTCGKNERAHQRVQKWLSRRPAAHDLHDLQRLLEEYREAFNNRRNHVLGKLTPQQRHDLGPLATLPDLPPAITTLTRHVVTTSGAIGLDGLLVGLGRRHAHQDAIALRTGAFAAIFVGDELTRTLILDYTGCYQPLEHWCHRCPKTYVSPMSSDTTGAPDDHDV